VTPVVSFRKNQSSGWNIKGESTLTDSMAESLNESTLDSNNKHLSWTANFSILPLQTAQYTLWGIDTPLQKEEEVGGSCDGWHTWWPQAKWSWYLSSPNAILKFRSKHHKHSCYNRLCSVFKYNLNFVYFILKTEILFVVTLVCDLCNGKWSGHAGTHCVRREV
jgi:hypothetical protein